MLFYWIKHLYQSENHFLPAIYIEAMQTQKVNLNVSDYRWLFFFFRPSKMHELGFVLVYKNKCVTLTWLEWTLITTSQYLTIKSIGACFNVPFLIRWLKCRAYYLSEFAKASIYPQEIS